MGIAQSSRSTGERSDELRTKREVLATYLSNRSPRVLLVGLFLAAVVRLLVGSWSWADLVVVAITVVLVGPVEWILHRALLHSPDHSFRMRVLKTGTGHREHHLDPRYIGWILLAGTDAFVFQLLIAVWTATWAVPLLVLIGPAILAPYLTALVAAYVALAHYEWVHLLVHSNYRPKTRYYRRLATNHRLHHHRNERYWLGVTTNLGDRLFATYPASKSDVPLSETARSLG